MGQENFPVMWGEGENLILWTCPPIAIPISLDPQKNFLPKIGRKLKGEIGHNFWKKMPMYSCTWASSTLLFFTFLFGFFFSSSKLPFLFFFFFWFTGQATSTLFITFFILIGNLFLTKGMCVNLYKLTFFNFSLFHF